MATHREAEELTGLQVGGISALTLLDGGFQVYLNRSAENLSAFVVSAGQRGMNLRMRVDDFVRLTKARFVEASVARENV
jgi:Cys-tRNA(Pro)/Cys-tRNA(Cys) deacylase